MNKLFDKYGKNLALIVLVLSLLIMSYIIYELAMTKRNIATNYVANVKEQIHHELDKFFVPISTQLKTTAQQLSLRNIHDLEPRKIKRLLLPVIDNYPQISSISLETEGGFDFDIIRNNKQENYFIRYIDSSGLKPIFAESNFNYKLNDVKLDTNQVKEEFIIAATTKRKLPENKSNDLTIQWLDPDFLTSTNKLGVTALIFWPNGGPKKERVMLAVDIELKHITSFVQKIVPSPNGHLMLLSNDRETVIGKPRTLSKAIEIEDNTLMNFTEIGNEYLKHVVLEAQHERPFSWRMNGSKWWGAIQAINLSRTNQLYVVSSLPEKDFLKEINEAQQLLIGGFFGISLLTLLIVRSHTVQRKQKQILIEKNAEIVKQSNIIEKKNEEILASINYAKRIQQAILPPSELINEVLPSSFVLYLPKDIVAGDFYWIEKVEDKLFVAAADCTGHGVPGAMVSVLCHNALSRCVRELNLTSPAAILDKTRAIVIDEFSQSIEQVNDGMDISLITINMQTNKAQWAGANCPLWIMRQKNNDEHDLLVLKPDKQPVANFVSMEPFTNHEVTLQKGDKLYLFSDGFQDQFGGKNNKKYKVGRLKKYVSSLSKKPMSAQKELFEREFYSWKGELEQIDDVCLIGIEIE